MKVITDKKIINLDSFDAVEYKALFGGFSVEATFMGEKEKIKEESCRIVHNTSTIKEKYSG